MKKIVLALVVLGFSVVTIDKVALADNEHTSGGLTPEQLEKKGNVQLRTVSKVGGGTWTTLSSVNGRTISEYYHRDKKHSATVSRTNGIFHKSVKPAGQWAKASLPYVYGQNSVYWNNAPKEPIGDYYGRDF